MAKILEIKPRGTSHVVGTVLTVEDKLVRQRCCWCREVLVEIDLSCVAVPEGQEMPKPGWEAGTWINVEGQWPKVYTVVEPEEGKYPNNSCMARELNS